MIYERVCPVCDEEFSSEFEHKVYCSSACRDKRKRMPKPLPGPPCPYATGEICDQASGISGLSTSFCPMG